MLLKQSGSVLLIVFVFSTLLLVGAGAYYLGTQRVQTVTTLPPLKESPTSQPSASASNTLKTKPNTEENGISYKDNNNILSFNAPSGWTVSNLLVAKGSTMKNPAGGYDINAADGETEVINIKKTDWTIVVVIKKEFTPKSCGGVEGFTSQEEYIKELEGYRKIPFLGQEAMRMKLEDGKYWIAGDQPTPYPQPIFFQTTLTKFNDPNSSYNGQYISNYPFCYEDPDIPVAVGITYLSPTFTADNIKNKKLDLKTIQEMDKILESFKLSR